MQPRVPYRQFLFEESADESENAFAFSTVVPFTNDFKSTMPLLTNSNVFIKKLSIVALSLVILVLLLVGVLLIYCLRKFIFLQKRLADNNKFNADEVNIVLKNFKIV